MSEPASSVGLDWLVTGAAPEAPLPERLAWLEAVVAWIRTRGEGATPETRLRFLLQVLQRNPDSRQKVARTLRATLAELSSVALLCETGLPRAHAFLQELGGRLAAKLLPAPPVAPDLSTLFTRLFPRAEDADWVANLPRPVREDLLELLRDGADGTDADPWRAQQRDIEDAVLVLASDVQAIGLSWRVRRRVAAARPRDTPFAGLSHAAAEWLGAVPGSPDRTAARSTVASNVARCRRAIADAMGHLESYGVSTDLVYTLERARLSLKRMEELLMLTDASASGDGTIVRFVARLIRANAEHRSVVILLRENGRLLARRVVESAERTGEHYLTRDAPEYRAMVLSAAIGGAITGFTVLVKLTVTGRGLPPFVEGLLASINYALSFVAIHLLHGTLATKQPATTAATLAARLSARHRRGKLRQFVDEVASLVRSQIAAITGNLLLVVPCAMALQLVWLLIGGGHVPDAAHAQGYVDSLSLLGATPIYAAVTGALLWLSAIIAGWFENWARYRRLPEAVAASPFVQRWLGPRRAAAVAGGIERNVAALGGNISLGLLLGMTPEIVHFFGIPLEVRHVTLATGQLALASYTLGSSVLVSAAFWWAVAGIAVTGFMNLTVSFCLALWVAIRSTPAGVVSRRRLWRAVISGLGQRPRDFLLPPRTAVMTAD